MAEIVARITVPRFTTMKAAGEKITMLTAYDYTMARLLDAAGVDGILVGDSMSMVAKGHENTLPVTLDEMIYHAEMVGGAVERADQRQNAAPIGSRMNKSPLSPLDLTECRLSDARRRWNFLSAPHPARRGSGGAGPATGTGSAATAVKPSSSRLRRFNASHWCRRDLKIARLVPREVIDADEAVPGPAR